MSRTKLSVRLRGELPPLDELTARLGVSPSLDRRRGTPIPPRGKRLQPTDVWMLHLAEWEHARASAADMARAAAMLRTMAPGLKTLDRTKCRTELYISAIREEEQGGFDLPTEVIGAAAAGELELIVSILVAVDDNEDDEEDDGT